MHNTLFGHLLQLAVSFSGALFALHPFHNGVEDVFAEGVSEVYLGDILESLILAIQLFLCHLDVVLALDGVNVLLQDGGATLGLQLLLVVETHRCDRVQRDKWLLVVFLHVLQDRS